MNECSFGIIPLRKNADDEWEVFLIQHQRSMHWSFPKGHAEDGEEPLDTACRELTEETGLRVTQLLEAAPLVEHYTFSSREGLVFKKVSYFLATVEGMVALQKQEVADSKWVLLEEAIKHLSFKEAKRLSQEALEYLKKNES